MTRTPKDNEERFDKIDRQLQDMNKRFDDRFQDMNKRFDDRFQDMNQQLDRIATVVVKGFERIDKAMEEKASTADVQRILGLLDALVKRQEISDDERLVMAHQLTRLHDWVEQAAERIDLKFAH